MGSIFESKDKAAKILGVSLRTIQRYLRQGKLRPAVHNGKIGVHSEDLASLAQIKNGGKDSHYSFSVSRATLGQLLSRMLRAEQRLNTLEHILNIKRDDLNLSDDELEAMYKSAVHSLVAGWYTPAEESWGGFFIRLQTSHLERLEILAKEKHPWIPFYKLACRMAEKPRQAQMADLLTAGRNHLRDTATVWCVLRGESPHGVETLFRQARD